MRKTTRWMAGLLSAAMVVGTVVGAPASTAKAANGMPDELLLASFFVSEENVTDVLYWSLDGENFYELSHGLEDSTPNDASKMLVDTSKDDGSSLASIGGRPIDWDVATLRDPSIGYYDGMFWMLSGFADDAAGRFVPMFSYSKDLKKWSFPSSGSGINSVFFKPLEAENGKDYINAPLTEIPEGAQKIGRWTVAGPELFVDTDGTFWVIFTAGYFAAHFGDSNPLNDVMTPYICKVDSTLQFPKGTDLSVSRAFHEQYMDYSKAVPIKLPSNGLTGENNRIDPYLYVENGTYYMVIKRNGVSNEIWKLKTGLSLDAVQNAANWELIDAEAARGTEGPSLVKFNGKYMLFTDKLASYQSNYDGKTGIKVSTANSLSSFGATYGTIPGNMGANPSDPVKNFTNVKFHDKDGNTYEGNRHGTVIKLADKKAIEMVWKVAMETRYKNVYPDYANPTFSEEEINPEEAVYPEPDKTRFERGADGKFYWYENNVKQGTMSDPKNVIGDGTPRGREICDLVTEGWYWLDSKYDGAKACNKEVWMPYIYQQEKSWTAEQIHNESLASGIMAPQVERDIKAGTGKWVRYDKYGRMFKGWYTVEGDQAKIYPNQKGNTYYYDPKTGLMAKGTVEIDGYTCVFDETTGVLQSKTKL